MILCDVNVYVHAFQEGSPRHVEYRSWLQTALASDAPLGFSDLALSGFLRIVTHPRVFDPPAEPADALAFTEAVRGAANAVPIVPGGRHWEIFTALLRSSGARGNAVPDVWLAALAIESGSEWVTTDLGFARYRGLRHRHPLDGTGTTLPSS